MKQKGPPTHFFTQSCADLYDPVIKKLLHSSDGELFKKVAANPQIIDFVFTEKLRLWYNLYITKIFDVDWYYTRNLFQTFYICCFLFLTCFKFVFVKFKLGLNIRVEEQYMLMFFSARICANNQPVVSMRGSIRLRSL